jgi:type I restriction-modification system DNA methylase subunit
MYRVDRNDFYRHQKVATVFTPAYVSEFLHGILSPHIKRRAGVILDPCVGAGSLLHPWRRDGYRVRGVDIEHQGFAGTLVKNYLELARDDIDCPVSLVVMNPPFNIDRKTKAYIQANYGGRPLLPEVWLQKALELFGTELPIVMFTPYGFRLNQTERSTRWRRFITQQYPPITSIVSLPKDVFPNVLFHSEVLIFNLPEMKGHYFVERSEEPLPMSYAKRPVAA